MNLKCKNYPGRNNVKATTSAEKGFLERLNFLQGKKNDLIIQENEFAKNHQDESTLVVNDDYNRLQDKIWLVDKEIYDLKMAWLKRDMVAVDK